MTVAPDMVSYLPTPARIVALHDESCDTRTFVLEPDPGTTWPTARPGQFVMLSLLGEGEAAFTISAQEEAAAGGTHLALTVRRVGRLTTALFALRAGARVGIRGPYGRGFPGWPASADLLFVAGGCGLAPLRAAITERVAAGAARTTIVYGARDPAHRIFRADLERWRAAPRVSVLDCVEEPDASWRGLVGDVAQQTDAALRAAAPAFAAVCGPPAMMAAVARHLTRAGMRPEHVSLAIERQMKCGFGICGRCYVGHRLACVDGPVLSLAELAPLDPAFHHTAPSTSVTAGR